MLVHHAKPDEPIEMPLVLPLTEAGPYLIISLITNTILYDHMIMYVGLFGHSAVVFCVFMFFSCFYVLLTVFSSDILFIYSAV